MDKELDSLINQEKKRQEKTINLIASENFASDSVLQALGSVLTNKYAEGYPGRRYYGGTEIVDKVERLAQERALKLFKVSPKKWGVNVQPYSGSPANLAVYFGLVPIGEKIMGMRLDMGGHLTHGHQVNLSGKLWRPVFYGVDRKSEKIDYQAVERIALKENPKLIVAGYTAYPRRVSFKKFRAVADKVGALLLADISHIAGLVASGIHPSPFPHADIVMTTTHKTLRGPRAAMIFARRELMPEINKAVFPGLQGGPHLNQIAAMAAALHEASRPQFQIYIRQVVKNAKAMAEEFRRLGWRIVSGGTDIHLFLVDTAKRGVSGKEAENLLAKRGIIVNKNAIPFDSRPPADPSGIRIGTAFMTTLGWKERAARQTARLISSTLLNQN